MSRSVWRDPLLHFLVIGGLLLVADSLRRAPAEPGELIVIGQAALQAAEGRFQTETGQPPTPEQRDQLVQMLASEEALYREALRLGLDEGDLVVRRRLVEKVRFLYTSGATQLSDDELALWFDENAERYRTPARVTVEHRFFASATRESPELDARAALAGELEGVGDPFLHGLTVGPASSEELDRLFGPGFGKAAFALQPSVWSGPVSSSYGAHLLRVIERAESALPGLEQLGARVRADASAEREGRALEEATQTALQRYTVRVEAP